MRNEAYFSYRATGFVGVRLVRELLRRGECVRAFGRNRSILDVLQAAGAESISGDLRDSDGVARACHGAGTVYHVGALSSPWGKVHEFEAANVGGTRNVIEGCRAGNVGRVVYVSSPSVTLDGSDCVRQTEAAPYPTQFVSHYSRTKKEGEDLVNAARGDIETVIVRPKAVFGPGDTSLLPRLLRAAKANRLPQIGPGTNRVDLTYVDNVVHALLLAGSYPNAVGKTYTITNGDPGADAPCLWGVIGHVLASLHLPKIRRTLPLSVALAIAGTAEAVAGVTGREPFLTRYTALILARTQTYDISAARSDLGYAPVVPLAEGLERTIAALQDAAR
jgi:nucleoside-diphosphate-sugar epimerase